MGFRLCGMAELPLAFAEKFFHLQNFRALQMPELGCPAIDARRNQGRRWAKDFGVPISLHNLRRKRALPGRTTVEVPRVVLDVRADADLAHHLEVVGGAHAEALGLEQLLVLLQPRQPLGELDSIPSIAARMCSSSVA